MQEFTMPVNQWTPPIIISCITRDTSPEIVTALSRLDLLQPVNNKLTDNERVWRLAQIDTKAADTSIGTLGLIRHDGVKLGINFTSGKALHRFKENGRGAQHLKKALGLHSASRHVIDTTGGLGQDAWAIASLGCHVTLCESHPIVHALLENALHRASQHTPFAAIAGRINLVLADSCDVLAQLANANPPQPSQTQVDAIFLDPMYPERRKSSQTKKGMQFLHDLLGPADDRGSNKLLQAALHSGVRRIVVKRPKGAPSLDTGKRWQGQLTSSSSPNTRYDIYHQVISKA